MTQTAEISSLETHEFEHWRRDYYAYKNPYSGWWVGEAGGEPLFNTKIEDFSEPVFKALVDAYQNGAKDGETAGRRLLQSQLRALLNVEARS